MSIWKQMIVSLVVLAVAAAGWIYFFPSSGAVLARLGIDWVPLATAEAPAQQERTGRGGGGGGPEQAVVTEPVSSGTINDRLNAIGTGRAANTVSVRPFSSGRIVEIGVSSGQQIEQGDVIARLDSETEEIAADRARLSLEDARRRLERVEQLRASNTASAVQLTEAELAVRNAELAVRDAELALTRRTIRAPIRGVVGILPVTRGNFVDTSTEVATIDDRSSILVDFWAAERFAGQIEVGMPLTASSIARPGEVFEGTVSALDNRIDAESRTLRVEARVTNSDDRLRAGMSFQVTMRFAGDSYASVNPLAVQWGADGAFVWAVREGLAVRTPVRIIQRNTESILVEAEFQNGDEVVTEGVHAVREGAPVMLARNGGAAREAQPAGPAPARTASGT